MKDVIDAVSSRIKTPYFGYALLAFFALNWRGIFILFAMTGSPQERLLAFDSLTSQYTLLILPLLVGALVAASTSWVQYFFQLISIKPLRWTDNLYLEAEHIKTIRQAELERSRSDLFAVKEKELIDRAKRDEEVAGIEDDGAKEKLSAQLESLRKERDQLSVQLKNQSKAADRASYNISREALEIIKAASQSVSGQIIRSSLVSGRSINAGSMSFGSESSRNFARYDAALNELINYVLVKAMDAKGQVFQLTDTGWQLSDSFK